MKKAALFILSVILLAPALTAQNNSISGEWLFTKAVVEGKSEEAYQIMNLGDDGSISLMGITFGSWKYSDSGNSISIKANMVKEFNGTWEIHKQPSGELIWIQDKKTFHFERYDKEETGKKNSKSGLEGVWEITDNLGGTGRDFIRFSLPDTVETVYIDEGSVQSAEGTWIYKSSTQKIIMMIHDEILRGSHSIEINGGSFVIDRNSEAEMQGKKQKENTENMEEMTMDPPEEEIPLNMEEFPWCRDEAIISNLDRVKSLEYIKSTLLNKINFFVREKTDTKIPGIFGEISAREMDWENVFYPLEEPHEYTVIGEKEVTVPAGTFACTEIEIYDDFNELKVRAYMINNQPGIYAKVIILKRYFSDEEYTMYELSK